MRSGSTASRCSRSTDPIEDPCVPNYVGFAKLPVGPGHLINPRWALRRAIVSFTELHNLMVLDRWQQDVSDVCIDADAPPPDADALPPDADAR